MGTFRKFWFLFLVIIIEGSSLMTVELLSTKLLAPFYGNSLYVWTAILSITLIGLTSGYHFGGKLSAKNSTEKHLILILSIAALLVFALPASAGMLIALSSNMGLISGISFAGFLLLVPPMFCFGLVGPMVVSLMTQKIDTVGNIAGSVYFTSTIGGILATILFGFYWIPDLGIKNSAMISAFSLALLPLVYIVKTKLSEKNIPQNSSEVKAEAGVKSPTKPKIKSNKQKNRSQWSSVYYFAVLEGSAVMAVQLIAVRMMAPYFGSSLSVWVTVIAITLFSLAIGYLAGGKLADKYTDKSAIHWVLLIASVFLMSMHFSSRYLTLAFTEMNFGTAAGLLGFILIAPPLLCLGTVPTLLIRQLTRKVDNAGLITGRVFTISSASGIISLIFIGFYIIPEYGLTIPSIAIGLMVGIISFSSLVKDKKYISFVFIAFFLISLSQRDYLKPSPDLKILAYSEGLMGQILVADVLKNGTGASTNDRLLFINRMGQTFMDNNTHSSKWNYITFASSIASKLPENSKALILGLGGGSVANVLHNNLKFKVDAVELDERIAETAREFFALNSNVNVFVDDARHFLEKSTETYDLIFFDVFNGDVQPAHVLSLECFKKAKMLLNKNGLIVINFNGFLKSEAGKPGRSIYITLNAAGLDTKILPTPGKENERNTLYIASQESQDFLELRSPLFHSGKAVNMETLFLDTNKFNFSDAEVFTDDKSGLDRMNIEANHIWRKAYNDSFTRFFLENGIPLFN